MPDDSYVHTPSAMRAAQAALAQAELVTAAAQAAQAHAELLTLAAQASQKSAESISDALKASELRYRRLFESTGDGILILDPETGKISDANPFIALLLGYPPGALLGKELWEIGVLRDKETSQIAYAQLQRQGAIRYENMPLETRQGEIREVEFVSNLYNDFGYTFIQCNIRNIAVRKAKQYESEKESGRVLADAIDQADHDPLTNLLNQRAFYRRLDEETVRVSSSGECLAVAVLDLDNFKFFNDVYGHSVGDIVLRTVADRLGTICGPEDERSRFGGDEFALLLKGIGSVPYDEIAERLREQMSDLVFTPQGSISAIPITVSLGVALFPDDGMDFIDVLNLADSRLLRAKSGERSGSAVEYIRAVTLESGSSFSLMDALVTAVDNKDRYTRHHSEDVMEYSLAIARQMDLGAEEQQALAIAALLHDVGKIGVPDRILRKPGRLTAQEFETVKQHPQMGALIIAGVPGLEHILDMVRHHHERWDGQGYPYGLVADQTPLLARILAVADAYSAITTDRPYRMGIAKQDAILILQDGAGTQWDPTCVNAFLRCPL